MSDAADQLTRATQSYRERVEAAGAAAAAQVAASEAAAESTDEAIVIGERDSASENPAP